MEINKRTMNNFHIFHAWINKPTLSMQIYRYVNYSIRMILITLYFFPNQFTCIQVLSSKKRDESAIPIFSQQPKTPKTPKAPKVSFNKDEEVIISSPTTLQSPKGRRSTTPTSSTSSSPNSTPHSHSNGGGEQYYPSLSRAGTRRGAGPTPIIYSQSTARRSKPKPIEKKLECTLEELWRGCVKKIKITRDVISETG